MRIFFSNSTVEYFSTVSDLKDDEFENFILAKINDEKLYK